MFVINLHDGISGLYKTYLIDWNECFAHKLRIEKGVIINDEEIEDDDAIYFEFF